MNAIFSIVRVTVIEQIRNRLYLVILLFGGAILCASMLVGALAPGHVTRVTMDLGLLAMELFGLATAVFGAVSLVIQEMESKTIYLLLTRPLPRWMYIVGRFLGLMAAVILTMGAMAVLHLLILISNHTAFREFTYGWSFWPAYGLFFLLAVGKMTITSALALFFSLSATSSVSALVFTGFFWVAGHFESEMAFMIDKMGSGPMRAVMKAAGLVFPNFQYFNLRDLFTTHALPSAPFLFWCFVYGLCYAGFFLTLSAVLFARKEF